jgi:hypothetical protein
MLQPARPAAGSAVGGPSAADPEEIGPQWRTIPAAGDVVAARIAFNEPQLATAMPVYWAQRTIYRACKTRCGGDKRGRRESTVGMKG